MADTVSKKKRSEIMSAIRSKDTQIEKLLQKMLRLHKLRFKINVAKMPGKPDIVFVSKKLAIFIDSCFWHGCKQHCRLPATNRTYWKTKIERNKKRDKDISTHYKKTKWNVLRFWEHQLKTSPKSCIKKITLALKNH